ncbi:GTP 3',8-cyclase MoaA [Candidatus Latescibacterota bacterium]
MTNRLQRTNPVSLRISVTDNCQLRCLYCRPAEEDDISQHSDLLTFDTIINFVNFLNRHYQLSKVHITGGEPLVRPGIVELIKKLSAAGIGDIALTTNGQLLGKMAIPLKRAGLKRINISLDSLDTDNFHQLTRGGELYRTLEGVEAAIKSGLSPVKLNTVVLRHSNDHEIVDIAGYGMERNCRVRFLELMPIGVSAAFFSDWFVSSDEVMKRLAEKFELSAVLGQSGSSSCNYRAYDSKGTAGIIGFISPYTAPFCSDCRRLRLTSNGRLFGCLARKESYEIGSLLRDDSLSDGASLLEVINSALTNKHSGSRFTTLDTIVKIGG